MPVCDNEALKMKARPTTAVKPYKKMPEEECEKSVI
jgi:hypothetical protein